MPSPRVSRRILLAACAVAILVPAARAQAPAAPPAPEQVDAQRTREQLMMLLDRYPPGLRAILATDPTLLTNESYLAPYPGLSPFLKAHPEIQRNPQFYFPATEPRDGQNQMFSLTEDVLGGMAGLTAGGMAVGLLIWLIRTFVDYRRWSRLASVQAEFHSKLLDRFSANAELLAYIQSPAGSKFLESAPIALDAAPRSMGAPLGRILWSGQAGLVLLAAGIGLQLVSQQIPPEAAPALHVLGVLAMSLGLGFLLSAGASFVISNRLGLIENLPKRGTRGSPPDIAPGNLG